MNNQIDIIGVLENRNSKLKVNHRIGNRDIANQELKEISNCIDNLIPHIREAVEKAKKYDDKMAMIGMNFYDEAIATFHDMHPEYDTANGGTHLLHDKVLDALKRAKKVEELLGLYQKRFSFYNFDEDKSLREIKLKEKELEELE